MRMSIAFALIALAAVMRGRRQRGNIALRLGMASLAAAASKGATSVDRWQSILQAAHTAQDALERSGNTKLVLTELMLAL